MSTAVQEILARIDELPAAEQEELRDALRLRQYTEWERMAEQERARSVAEGITEQDIVSAVAEIRYGKKPS